MLASGLYPWLLSRHQHRVLGSGEFLVTKQHEHEGKKWDLQKPSSFVTAKSQNQWRNRHKWWPYNIINVCEIWCRLDLVSRDKPAQTWALGDDQFCLHLRGDSWCSPSRRTPVRNTKLRCLTTMYCVSSASTHFWCELQLPWHPQQTISCIVSQISQIVTWLIFCFFSYIRNEVLQPK